jgi:hypothetical protein
MQKVFLGFIFTLALTFVYAQKGCEIKLKINHFQGKTLLIAYHFGNKQYILDSLHQKDENGFWIFKRDTLIPAGIYMCVLPPKNPYFEFLVDRDSQQFSIETDSFDLAKNIQITHSPLNQLFYKDIHFIHSQREKMEVLQQKINEAKNDSIAIKTSQGQLKEIDDSVKAFRKKIMQENPNSFYTAILRARQEPEIPQKTNPKDTLFSYCYYKSHYWEGVDFNDERLLRTPILYNKIDYYLDKLTNPCFDSTTKEIRFLCENAAQNKKMYQYFVVTILNKYGSMCTNTKGLSETYFYVLEEYYANREPFWCDSIQRQQLINRLEGWKRTTAPVSVIAPNLNMRNEQEEWISMKKQKASDWILYFWNLEDENAKVGIAEIKKIATKYGEILPNMKVYAVAVGGTRELFKAKVQEYGLDLPNIINVTDSNNETKYQNTYDVLSLPRIFLLDKDRCIRAKYIDAKQLAQLLTYNFIRNFSDFILLKGG